MTATRKLLAISLAALLLSVGGQARASSIRDGAAMFSPEAAAKARERLERVERDTGVATTIETVAAVPGLSPDSSREERQNAIRALARRKSEDNGGSGLYVLISKREHLIAPPLAPRRLETVFPRRKGEAVRDAFIAGFKKNDFDEGLLNGVSAIEESLKGARAVAGRPGAAGGKGQGGPSTMGTFLLIVGGIFGVLLLLRLLGGLFGGARRGYPGQAAGMGGMGRPGMGPRYGGPGYGGPGYGAPGGGRGGFFSGLLGGLGGAMAGNWLYDQMSGRHGGHVSHGEAYPPGGPSGNDPGAGTDPGQWADQGDAASWGNQGDGDAGGGDWGGGDAGGGDWGGGDGGGGDWGGGDGGGDWGGGDGGGGDW